MAKLSKGKKIVIGIVVAVLVATVICATVPQVRSSITDLIMKLDLNGDKQRQEKAHEDEHYKNLPEEEKEKFDQKINQIIESNEYKRLTDDEKDVLIDKFLESEIIQQELKIEQEEQEMRKEEVRQELENLVSKKQELEQKVQDLKNLGASEEEIKAAEEEKQKIKEQIEEVEQEQKYFNIIDTVNNSIDVQIKKIYGIYRMGAGIYINTDIVKTKEIVGVEIHSQTNVFYDLTINLVENPSYDEVLQQISNYKNITIFKTCTNRNAESHKEFFEQNKYSIDPSIKKGESKGYRFSFVESWENNQDSAHPEYLINRERDGKEDLFIITYSNGSYSSNGIQKICPEFWAQMEIEQNKQAEAQ